MSGPAPALDGKRLRELVPRGLLAGLAFGWILAMAAGSDGRPAAGGWGGDYPAFHTAGRIVLSGDFAHLYDLDVQQRYEAELLDEGFLAFLYPPFVAAFYAPLALLPYRASYLVFTLLSVGALVASMRLVSPMFPAVRRDPWTVFAALVLFYPMLRSTLGGQNTAISLVILCAAWRLFHEGRDLAGGVVLGLLAFKPQFLLPVAGVVFLAGRPLVVPGVAATGAALYSAGAAMMGWSWPATWWRSVGPFAARDREVNGVNSISAERITQVLGFDHAWVLLSLALSLWVAWVAWKKGREDFAGVFVFVVATAILISPHAMYYDLGLAFPALLMLADRGRAGAAALLWAGGILQLAAVEWLPSPLVAVTAAMVVMVSRRIAPGD